MQVDTLPQSAPEADNDVPQLFSTPQSVPMGEPPGLVPFGDDAASKANTPVRPRLGVDQLKSFTPCPTRRDTLTELLWPQLTPQPPKAHVDFDLDTTGTTDADLSELTTQTQPVPESTFNILQPLQQELQPAMVQPQVPVAGLGMQMGMVLYPVYEDGALIGYMEVKNQADARFMASQVQGVLPQQMQQQQQPYQQLPAGTSSQYGLGAQQAALTDLNINAQARGRMGAKAAAPHNAAAPNPAPQHQQGHGQTGAGPGAVFFEEGNIDVMAQRGKIIETARDHAGSRALQKRLDLGCTDEEKQLIFEEVEPCCEELMLHMFGNYVIQKLFEHGLPQHVQILSERLKGNVLDLTLSPYGCRVIQKALESIDSAYRGMVIEELTGQVPRCVQDQNGNHVIQKCIEVMPDRVQFIVSAFKGSVLKLAMHAYGCRVIQRLLEFCKQSSEVEPIIEEVLGSVEKLVGDRYGNYVVQHVIINGDSGHRGYVYNKLRGNVLGLARGKFSSNVVEKMFEFSTPAERNALLEEMLQYSPADGMTRLLAMVQDPYANYVVQKMLGGDCWDPQHQQIIADHIRPHVQTLRKFPYGKHIISRLEKAGLSANNGSNNNINNHNNAPAQQQGFGHPQQQRMPQLQDMGAVPQSQNQQLRTQQQM